MGTLQKPKLWALIAAILIGIAMLWTLWQRPSTPLPRGTEAPALQAAAPARAMQGTVSDGQIRVMTDSATAGGGLVVDVELRKFFDYHLSAVGEKTIEAIRAQAEAELDQRLSGAAAAYAKRLLGLYLAFKTALVELEQRPELAGNGVAALRARLLGMQQLRAQYFDEREAQGMFGFDDAYDVDAISRLEISQDNTLTPAQKQQALAALDVARSAELRDAHDAPMAVVHLEETAARMRQSGASDDEIYRMRAAAFDPQAASRLAEVDQEEALWKARIQAYLAARDQLLLAKAREPEAVRAAALAALRAGQFSADEQKRLAAYER